MTKRITVLALCILLSACATMMEGYTDTVTIVSTEPETKVYVDGEFVGRNDAIRELKRGEVHSIRVSKENCIDAEVMTGRQFDSTTFYSLFLGGGALIAIPLDWFMGTVWEVFPDLYNVTPKCP